MKKYNFSKEEIKELYFKKGLPQWKIADIYGCDQGTISHQFKKLGIYAVYNITDHKSHPKKFVICKYLDKNYFGKERYVIEVSTLRLKLKDKLLIICEEYFRNCYSRTRKINRGQYDRFVVLLRDFNPFPDHFYDSLKNDLERGV